MTRDELNAAIVAYIKSHLSPTPDERTYISGEYERLCGFLGGTCFQSGSYARYTSTTPVNDLDIIWVIPQAFIDDVRSRSSGTWDARTLDPSKLLKAIALDLEAKYQKAGIRVRIVPQSHSVGIYFGQTDEEFSIDLVPAMLSGYKNDYGDDTYLVPQIASLSKSGRAAAYRSHGAISWIKSDPKGYIADAREINDENENFRKVAKFVRKWRRGCKAIDAKFPLKSFHLELIVNDIFKETHGIGALEAIRQFFLKLPLHLVRPCFVDRADPNQHVDSYVAALTEAERVKINAEIHKATQHLEALVTANSHSQVNALIESLLSARTTSTSISVRSNFPVIRLGDHSHKQTLADIGVIDHGTYPCEVRVVADLFFRPPRGKKINRRRVRRITSGGLVPANCEIDFKAKPNLPRNDSYDVYWQVVNTGDHAQQVGNLRGRFFKGRLDQTEQSLYTGVHWIECFIVTPQRVCIARSGPFVVTFCNPFFPPALLR